MSSSSVGPMSPYAGGRRRLLEIGGRALSSRLFVGVVRPEHLLHLVEEALRLRMRVLAGAGGELLEQLALLLGELLGDLDGHPDVLVAALVSVQVGNSLTFQAEHLPALR